MIEHQACTELVYPKHQRTSASIRQQLSDELGKCKSGQSFLSPEATASAMTWARRLLTHPSGSITGVSNRVRLTYF